MVILIVLLAAAATFLGGAFALRYSDKLHLILGFSAGTIIGVVFFDLIPESLSLLGSIEKSAIAAAIGFSAYMIIERLFLVHNCEGHCDNPSHKGKLGATTLIIHSLIDGLIIGLSFQVSQQIGGLVSVAVLAHKFSDGINTAGLLLADKIRRDKIKKWLLLASLAPALGYLISKTIALAPNKLGIVLGLFAGLFMYLGASDLIPESHHKHSTTWTTISTIAGIFIIYLLTRILG